MIIELAWIIKYGPLLEIDEIIMNPFISLYNLQLKINLMKDLYGQTSYKM